ncbi:MAG: TonB-dependent receptor plug domain-containing protein, partial [Cyanobacteria bacterium P01_A01_bin.17]
MKKQGKYGLEIDLRSYVGLGIASTVHAQESDETSAESDEDKIERIQVTGSLGSLPGQDVESVFGFGKSILETPRSVSTISDEQLERFNIGDIDELVAFAPGTFTQSFFGVAGSLDVRGTPGETYFRGYADDFSEAQIYPRELLQFSFREIQEYFKKKVPEVCLTELDAE